MLLTGTGTMITDPRAGTGTTRPRIQVDIALSALLNPGVPIIASISPDRGMVGTSLTVTVNGINFEPGVSVSFGAGVTVTSTTVVSSRELAVAIEIPTLADAGPPSRSRTLAGSPGPVRGVSVTLPPATISLSFVGKLRDMVGQGSTAFSADGALDGTLRVIVQSGIWARTVTRLELRGNGVWDTDGATAHWALGAAASLDGALLNGSNGAVSFAVADGGVFFVFASDLNPTGVQWGVELHADRDLRRRQRLCPVRRRLQLLHRGHELLVDRDSR